MTLENKLGIQTSNELAREEERISKPKALQLYESGYLDQLKTGTFQALSEIHRVLFEDIYDFAGKIRTENIAKGHFRFASAMYLEAALKEIDRMPISTYGDIIAKYVEMNVAHPFREGNGRSMRIWLDDMLKKSLGQVIDWSLIDKDMYLSAMERSPVNDLEINYLLKKALTTNTNDRAQCMKGVDYSYYYEGYNLYKLEDLARKQEK